MRRHEEDPEAYARQRKKEANHKHHARKKATAVVVAAVQAELDAARAAHAELQLEHSVLAAAAAHQQGSVQVLQLAGLAAAADPDASPAAALPTSGAPTWKETLYAAEEPGVLPGGAAAAALLAHQHMQVEQPAAAVRPHEQSGSGSGDAASSHSTSPEPSSGDGTQRVAPQSSNTRSSSGQESAASAGAGAAAASLAGSAGAAGGGHGANSRSWLEQAMLLQSPVDACWHTTAGPPAWVRTLALAGVRLLPNSVLAGRHASFMVRMQLTLQEWDARPGARAQLEAVMARRLSDRQFMMRMCAHYRPADVLQMWRNHGCPPAPAQAPALGAAGASASAAAAAGRPGLHELLVPIAHHLETSLPPGQKAELREAWVQYLRRTDALRCKRAAAAMAVDVSAALHMHAWQTPAGSSAAKAQCYADMCEGAGSLATLTEAEIFALMDLQGAVMTLLRPVDAARVLLAAHPYMTDLTQICAWLFPETLAPSLPPPPPPPLPGLHAGEAAADPLACPDALLDMLMQEDVQPADDLGLLLGELTGGAGQHWAAPGTDAGHLVPPQSPGRPGAFGGGGGGGA